eukprot:1157876-Pelagomonas_calceolata.AAC.7
MPVWRLKEAACAQICTGPGRMYCREMPQATANGKSRARVMAKADMHCKWQRASCKCIAGKCHKPRQMAKGEHESWQRHTCTANGKQRTANALQGNATSHGKWQKQST